MSKGTCSRAARCRALIAGLLVAGAGLASSVETSAQELYGSVVGVVTDAQGGVLPGAAVVIVNRNTGLKRESTTNADGGYTQIDTGEARPGARRPSSYRTKFPEGSDRDDRILKRRGSAPE